MGRKPKAAKAQMMPMPANANPSMETANPEPKMEANSAGLSLTKKKVSKNQSAIVRRSERINNLTPSTRIQVIDPVIEEAPKRNCPIESPDADLKCRSLYIDSQKKIEVLKNENCQLAKKLEFTVGKLEAYENGTRVCSEVIEKLTILISNLAKATDIALLLSSQAIYHGFSSPDAAVAEPKAASKRKRLTKRIKK
ncbi:hypothetical protein F0562_002558 [Nyssa sinensis]|uniref:Uncharacterized protein n=1 Tax=Nyssa sinensis TaxID=561372 RepID=A0A5J5C7R6_9ASTE|nr:hypothetical protein F0562_002558 [Nyssa sinensis]